MKTKFLLFAIFFFTSTLSVQARHILGGSLTYTHLNNDNYQIDVNVYRDCNTDGAPFDTPATIVLYRGDAMPYVLVQQFQVTPSSVINNLGINQDDCVSDPYPFCLEKGIYTFEVDLPASEESYHIVYQRCCRNNTYSNIDSPESVGFTITNQISSTALQSQNSSPDLVDTPLFEVCSGADFDFSIAVPDSNADSIIYELCTPIIGGGPLGTASDPGDPNACNGVQPVPSCPPPYDNISYASSDYNFENPLGTEAFIDLDRNTGLLTGVPFNLGQFLVGVCITEYVDGEAISVTTQELTFWVDFASDINTQDITSLSFFPNPATDQVFITLPQSSESFDLQVRDINGTIVRAIKNISGSNYKLSTERLEGLCFLELRSQNETYFGRLLVL